MIDDGDCGAIGGINFGRGNQNTKFYFNFKNFGCKIGFWYLADIDARLLQIQVYYC
jgi:hypothetical protein